jgi:hypothetical protein
MGFGTRRNHKALTGKPGSVGEVQAGGAVGLGACRADEIGKIAGITDDGSIKEYDIPTPSSQPIGSVPGRKRTTYGSPNPQVTASADSLSIADRPATARVCATSHDA